MAARGGNRVVRGSGSGKLCQDGARRAERAGETRKRSASFRPPSTKLLGAVLAMFSRRAALGSLLLSQAAHGLRLHPALSTTRLRGGASSFAMSATAVVESSPAAPVEKFRLDYVAPPYVIDTVHLDFSIAEEETLVKARLEIKRGAGADGAPMELEGDKEAVELREITLDGKPITLDSMTYPTLSHTPLCHLTYPTLSPTLSLSTAPCCRRGAGRGQGLHGDAGDADAAPPARRRALHAGDHRGDQAAGQPAALGALQVERQLRHPVRGRGLPPHHLLPGNFQDRRHCLNAPYTVPPTAA